MNTHIPAPPWATVVPVQIPLVTCNKAADWLIEWFGPEELKHVVGGERWWQVRGLDHLDAEWVTQKELLSPEVPASDHRRPDKKLSTEDKNILRMEDLPVMVRSLASAFQSSDNNFDRFSCISTEVCSPPRPTRFPCSPHSRWLLLGLYQSVRLYAIRILLVLTRGNLDTHRYQIIRYCVFNLLAVTLLASMLIISRSSKDARPSLCSQLQVRLNVSSHMFHVTTRVCRKAPQYPWPCPLHDVLAACLSLLYLPSFSYLTSLQICTSSNPLRMLYTNRYRPRRS